MRLVVVLLLAACGDNLDQPRVDCSALSPPPTGLGLDGAREAHRRAAQRQQLRYRDAIEPGYVMRVTAAIADQEKIDAGQVCPQDLAEVGRILFEHRFTYDDGLAAGVVTSPFRRVQSGRSGGPETFSCTSCHWRNGPAGGGGVADNAFLLGDGDRVSSSDPRNPPQLLGAGIVQALAEEMTADLAAQKQAAIAAADGRVTAVELVSKGVSFGTIRVDAAGRVSTEELRGVDADLVIKPFGWKGTSPTLTTFIADAAALHFGIESTLGDRDADGVADELTTGQLTALAVYLASIDMPVMRPFERPVDIADPAGPTEPFLADEWAQGRVVFEQVGCAQCHLPKVVLANPTITIRAPTGGVGVTVDLSTQTEAPRLTYDPAIGGYPVFLFSDLKRHNLGEDNASQHLQDGIGTRFYLTRPLWGVGDSAPYFYDGQAVTIEAAIERHGGEARGVRDAWNGLPLADKVALRVFLAALRREPRLVVP